MYCAIKFWKGKKKSKHHPNLSWHYQQIQIFGRMDQTNQKRDHFNRMLGYDTKSTSSKSKNQQVGLHQTKNQKRQSTKHKGNLQNRRKYLQIMSQIRG